MNKELTCIVCPNGCDLHIAYEKSAETIEVLSVEGALCKRGETYARQELIAPKRSIASSVLVEGGELPLVSGRTKGVIPKNMIFPVMKEIRKTVVKAPVEEGSVLIPEVLGLGIDVIATKRVEKKQG